MFSKPHESRFKKSQPFRDQENERFYLKKFSFFIELNQLLIEISSRCCVIRVSLISVFSALGPGFIKRDILTIIATLRCIVVINSIIITILHEYRFTYSNNRLIKCIHRTSHDETSLKSYDTLCIYLRICNWSIAGPMYVSVSIARPKSNNSSSLLGFLQRYHEKQQGMEIDISCLFFSLPRLR